MIALFTSILVFGESRRAFKLLEKGEYDKLIELLDKSVEKDSVNAGAKYLYSLLYLTTDYEGYDIDRSYRYIVDCNTDFSEHDVKMLEDLQRIGIDSSTISNQRIMVENHAYDRAKEMHTIEDYNHFIDVFDQALQMDSVIAFRDEIAYNDAVESNTYEAFQDFIYTYPRAIQIDAAKSKYEELLYVTKTQNGKLESYVRFLKNNPKSPYRDQAELNIFEISTADNDQDSYMTFIERYPESKMLKRAYGMMYHCYKEHSSPEGFSNRFGRLESQDSLTAIVQAEIGCLMPIFEMDRYGFSTLEGNKLIDFTYDKINEEYYCGGIMQDYLEVEYEGKSMVISRKGDVIFDGAYESLEDLGCGLLKIGKDGYYGVFHKSGFKILDFNFEDVGLVSDAFVKFKFNGKWGLTSFCSRDILEPKYDDIYSEGRFVIIEDDDMVAVQNVQNLSKVADKFVPNLDFRYDDFEQVYANQLLLFQGDKETVMNLDLKENLGLEKQNFYEFYGGWLVKKDGFYKIYDDIFYPLSDSEFSVVDYNRSKAALKYGDKWGIYSANSPFPATFEYDSVRFLSEQIGIIIKGDTTLAIFENDSLIDISNSREIRLLKPTSIELSEDEKLSQYLLARNSQGLHNIFNAKGHKIIDGKYSAVEALGKEYLLIERAGKKGLFHNSGEQALKVRYSGIGNYHNGYVSTLINGKFGLYNFDKGVFLSAKYQKAPQPFGRQYFIGTKGSMNGLVDMENREVSGFIFEKIENWNDSIALVSQEGEWKLYNILSKEFVYEGISEFTWLRNDDEEKIILITKNSKSGVLSNLYGEVVGPTFNDIVNVGTAKHPVYFAEKYIIEAEFYIVIYYNPKGEIIRKQIFTEPEEYEKIYCG